MVSTNVDIKFDFNMGKCVKNLQQFASKFICRVLKLFAWLVLSQFDLKSGQAKERLY